MYSIPDQCTFPGADVLAVRVLSSKSLGCAEFHVDVVLPPKTFGTLSSHRVIVSSHLSEEKAKQIAAGVAKKLALDRVTDDVFLRRDQIRCAGIIDTAEERRFYRVEIHTLGGQEFSIPASSPEIANAFLAALAEGATSLVDA